ncbi:MAG: 4-demethylwyosine synthase TYW1 [Candidatus Diapherotrites archaeon]
MLSEETKNQLYKQGYRFVGNHSAIKTCLWCRNSLRDEGECYKYLFYGIPSWRCVQMTPSLGFCPLRCQWCWRDISYAEKEWTGTIDDPTDIIDGCIDAQRELLIGYKGYANVNKKRFEEAMNPNQFAISLSGEPTLYPKLPEMIDELHKRDITSFVVSNGTQPDMIEKLVKKNPTQMYITLPAPNEETFLKSCNPLEGINYWKNINKSLSLLKKFKRSTIRLTLTRGLNMKNAEEYAELIAKAKPNFVELKAYMALGFSRKRVGTKGMPYFKEIEEFAQKLNNVLEYNLADKSEISRVILLSDGTKLKIHE